MFWIRNNCDKKNKNESKICTNCFKETIAIDSHNSVEKNEPQGSHNNSTSIEDMSSIEPNTNLNNFYRNCGTTIMDCEKKRKQKIMNNKYMYIAIIIFILTIVPSVLSYVSNIIYKFRVDNYIKNELINYNNYKISFNERNYCYEKSSPLFPFYERIPDCYDYKYEITFNKKDKVEASVYYYKKEGVKDYDVVINLQAYEKIKKVIGDFFDIEDLNIEGKEISGGIQFKVKVPIDFKENLNVAFFKKISEMRKVIEKEWIASEIYLSFDDDFELDLKSTFALSYKNNSSKYYVRSYDTSNTEDINKEITKIKNWIKRNFR